MSNVLKVLLAVLGGSLLTLLLVVDFSGGGMMRGMGPMMKGGGTLGTLFVLLFGMLVMTLAAGLVVWIVGQTRRH